ncbi:hypothetical protein C8J57DRAFT_1512781 [Mycena rebaudengoi]|nr:hypothetical protein C8J57DRAFT_1512781 [Mycena rebaudengoi]
MASTIHHYQHTPSSVSLLAIFFSLNSLAYLVIHSLVLLIFGFVFIVVAPSFFHFTLVDAFNAEEERQGAV